MTGVRYRFRKVTIVPDTEPEAEAWSFAMQCAVCEKTGPAGNDMHRAHDWVELHLKEHPEHLAYRELIARPYRVELGAWM